MRSPEELLISGLRVIDEAFATPIHHVRKAKGVERVTVNYAEGMAPLFSGGHDSTCACHVAAQHPKFSGSVHHINTGIGSKRTRKHVEETAAALGWDLTVWASPATYERFVSRIGFPGPGGHEWVYNWLKDRCVGMIAKGARTLLVTGCRSQESVRRMGHVEPVKVGDWVNKKDKKTGEVTSVQTRKNRIWTAPCHDWSTEEQGAYMEWFDLPKNPVKIALGMSGECFCGAFASPGELDRIRHHCPDVAEEIDRLTAIAKASGTPCEWGKRPKGVKGKIKVQRTGELCSTCDLRAHAAGIEIEGK